MKRPGTYEARLSGEDFRPGGAGAQALADYAKLYGRLERRLFGDLVVGKKPVKDLKQGYLAEHQIPARMFNSMRVSVQGKIDAVVESRENQLESLERQIKRAQVQIADAVERGAKRAVHGKKRRLADLQGRLVRSQADAKAGLVRLCFGSRKLWRKQYYLKASGYQSHAEWKKAWQSRRSDEFFMVGSRDETAGCQPCVATVADDGSLTLRLRMPDCLAEKHGKYLVITGVRFRYGAEHILSALETNADFARYRREHGEKAARDTSLGQALSYRFKVDKKGWRVFITTDMMYVPVITNRARGAVGVDLNADHLAVCAVDSSGNPVDWFRVPLVTYGKSRHQAEALIGDAVAQVVEYARKVGKPIVMERLDFRGKKAELEGESAKYNRMLSSLAYGKVKEYFHSRGYRNGVEVVEVSPAFSSVIGRVKFMERYGLSVDQAAALVLARRLFGYSERIPSWRSCPANNGVQVAFHVPVRSRVKHVWTYWGAISGQLRAALAAQHRLGRSRDGPNPVRAEGAARAALGA